MSFQWRAGDDRTTTGIWLWSEPFFRKIGKEEVAVLLMDTQVRGADYHIIADNHIIEGETDAILCTIQWDGHRSQYGRLKGCSIEAQLVWPRPGYVAALKISVWRVQGMFDNQTSMDLTACIFGLSTLLSSYQIYNVQNRIQVPKYPIKAFVAASRDCTCEAVNPRRDTKKQHRGGRLISALPA